MAFFCCWLGLHFVYLLVVAGVAPRPGEARPATADEWLAVACYYLIGFSWLLRRGEAPGALEFTAGFAAWWAGSALALWALASNPYFVSAIVRPPAVVRTGAYRWLNHPGYCGFVLQGAGVVAILNNRAGLLPLTVYALILWERARQEDRLLRTSR